MEDQTFGVLNWITQSNTQQWLEAAGLSDLPFSEFTND